MTAVALLRRFWPAVPILLLALALFATRARLADVRQTLTNERASWSAEIARAEQQRLTIERNNAARLAQATATYADRLAAREPIILRSTNTVRKYAQTDAGRVLCRSPDRVRAIDALDAELADEPDPAGSGAPTLPPDAAASPAGR